MQQTSSSLNTDLFQLVLRILNVSKIRTNDVILHSWNPDSISSDHQCFVNVSVSTLMQTHQADVLVLVLYSVFLISKMFQLHTVNDMIYSEAEALQTFLHV